MINKGALKGLTLIELLISISLLVGIMALLMSSLFQTTNFRERIDETHEKRQQVRIMKNIITRDLRSAVFLEEYVKTGEKNGLVHNSGILGINQEGIQVGGELSDEENSTAADQIILHVHRLSLNEMSGNSFNDPEIHEVAYFVSLNEDNESYSLYRKESFYIKPAFFGYDENLNVSVENQEGLSRNLLAEKVMSFNIEYLPRLGGSNAWNNDWNSLTRGENDELPEAVKVTIGLQMPNKNIFKETFEVSVRPFLGDSIIWKF